MPQPPAEYLAGQVSRLNEALLVSYSAMHNSATVGRTSKRSIESSGSCASSTAITNSSPVPAGARRVSRSAFPRPRRARSRLGLRSKLASQVIEDAQFGLANGRSVRSVIVADVRGRKRSSRAGSATSSRRAAAGVRVTISCRTTRHAPSFQARPPRGARTTAVVSAQAPARSAPTATRTGADWAREEAAPAVA
jgi:hypothetical protein